jgi:hypothetical protein
VGVSQVGYEYVTTTMDIDELKSINRAITSSRSKRGEGKELRAMKALFEDKWPYCDHRVPCSWPSSFRVPDVVFYSLHNITNGVHGKTEQFGVPLITLEVDGKKKSPGVLSLTMFETAKCMVVGDTALGIIVTATNIILLKMEKSKKDKCISVLQLELKIDGSVKNKIHEQLSKFLRVVTCVVYDIIVAEGNLHAERLLKLKKAGKQSMVKWVEDTANQPKEKCTAGTCYLLQSALWWEKHVNLSKK